MLKCLVYLNKFELAKYISDTFVAYGKSVGINQTTLDYWRYGYLNEAMYITNFINTHNQSQTYITDDMGDEDVDYDIRLMPKSLKQNMID